MQWPLEQGFFQHRSRAVLRYRPLRKHHRGERQVRWAARVSIGSAGSPPKRPWRVEWAEWIEHECSGWTVQNWNWHVHYQRLLIQSGPGIVRHCRFTRLGSSIKLNSVMDYVEGGVPRDITIKNNVFRDVNPQRDGAAIAEHVSSFERGKAPVMRNIAITSNTFSRPLGEAIVLKHCDDARVSGNIVREPTKP